MNRAYDGAMAQPQQMYYQQPQQAVVEKVTLADALSNVGKLNDRL